MYQIPLSPYTRIFYTEWRLEPNRSDYNIVFDQNLDGNIDILRLDNVIKRFISDYVILNSHIENKNEELYWVKNSNIYGLEFFDKEISNKDIYAYVQKPFNLEEGPLYRCSLIKYHSNKYRLIIILHHVIIDGSSVDYFINELSKYYNDRYYKNSITIETQLFCITKLSTELSKYVELNKEKSKIFWAKSLLDIEFLDISFLKVSTKQNNLLNHFQDKTELSIQQLSDVAEIRFNFNKEILLKLNQLKKKYKITPYLYGQNIFAVLLNRYIGQSKFCINYPIAITEGKDFIYGGHINTNAIIYDFNKTNNIIDVVNQSQQFLKSLKCIDISHSYLPISDIVSVSNKTILNCAFIQTNLKYTVLEFGNIKVKVNNDTNIDLTNELLFEQEIRNEEINYRVRYKLSKINVGLLNDFIDCYKRLFIEILNELVGLEDTTQQLKHIKNYNLLSYRQYQQIINNWNDTDKAYPSDKTIQALFEEQVARTPDNIAIVYEEIKLTYRQLNERANQLANYLRDTYEIKPDTLIALCLDRSEYMLIAILGVLKAGGAYVPMDPSYPDERISYILGDTSSKLILTNEGHKQRLKSLVIRTTSQIMILAIDDQQVQTLPAPHSVSNPATLTTSNNLAYVIYTSGTTGNPKGVMIEHIGIVSLVKNVDYVSINFNDSFIQFADIVFDAATFEIWASLLHGAKLFIPSNKIDLLANINLLQKTLITNKISVLWLTKTLFDQLFLIDQSIFKNIKYLLVGGEALNLQLISKLINSHDVPQNIINGYGPTENTTFSCTLNISKNNIKSVKTIPIGTALTNKKAYVLDTNLIPLPIGAIGELYTGGVGLARGYLNRPDLTAEKFIANPFQSIEEKKLAKNTRLYKTGDLVRWLPDGNLEYIGRNDFQVKIRGYRIELEEIESVLSSCEGVKQCVVLAKEHKVAESNRKNSDTSGSDTSNKYLAVYYVSTSGAALDEDVLLSYVRTKLPDYMVPSAFVHLEKVPLTTNGKLDRKALPEPGFGSTEGYVAPSNELEKTLSKIWTGVLDLPKDKIGVHDNFFNLGGNSITAIKLVANCKSNNIKINIKDIFNHYTIAKLANFIANLSNKKAFDNQETQLLIDDIKNNIATKELKKEYYINSEEINNILLTGVTGFLGSHMLIDLLNCTNANIYCIVRREANITTPKERLNKILTFAGYEHYINNSRIVILEGDLSKPNLGLSVSTIEQLSLIIDHIYHCGAQVHHLHSYKVLRAVNILATVELLKLSTYKKIKPLHYISTKDTESSSTSTELPMFNMGYIQSKWVSEKILESYIQKNYPIYIYRPGNITGHSSTGFCLPEKNHALLLLKGFIQQKIAPDWNKPFEMVPVDKISRAIVSLSLNSKKLVKNIFNLANHETISWATYISKINKLTTLGIKVIDSEEWRLNILSNIDLDNAIYPLKDIYIASPMDSNYKPTKDQETKEYLEMLQISYPTIEQYDDLLRVYLRYLTKVSFLKLPIIKD